MDLRALTCPSCAAPVDPGAERCTYCGASLVATADAALDPAGAGIDSHWACPACKGMLRSFARQGWSFDRCPACAGIWLPQGSLEHLWQHPEADGVAIAWAESVDRLPGRGLPAPEPNGSFYHPCPDCRQPMNRVHCGGQVMLDVCRAHGAWFDAGELAQLGAALRTGLAEPARLRQMLGRMNLVPVHSEVGGDLDLDSLAAPLGQGLLGVLGGMILGGVLGSLGSRR